MNKRRIWATSPVYYVMAAVMFIMACFSYTQNKILFAVEITVSGLCLAAVIMTDLHYRVHVYTSGSLRCPLRCWARQATSSGRTSAFRIYSPKTAKAAAITLRRTFTRRLCVRFYPKTEPPFPTATASLRPTACAPKAAVCFTLWTTRIISRFSAIIAKSARSLRLSRLITARS